MNEIRRISPFWDYLDAARRRATRKGCLLQSPGGRVCALADVCYVGYCRYGDTISLLRDRALGREVGAARRRRREPTTPICGRSVSVIRWLRVGRAFTISIVGCNDIAEIPASEMRYSVLVPVLLAMFGTEAVAQLTPGPAGHRG